MGKHVRREGPGVTPAGGLSNPDILDLLSQVATQLCSCLFYPSPSLLPSPKQVSAALLKSPEPQRLSRNAPAEGGKLKCNGGGMVMDADVAKLFRLEKASSHCGKRSGEEGQAVEGACSPL